MGERREALEVSLRRSESASRDEVLGGDVHFSYMDEVRYFFFKSMPMCLGSLMNFGVPALVALSLAGHTDVQQSAHLQASLGYARLWYNCTSQMPMNGLTAYFNSVVPGCLGAGRMDRLPRYLQRSVLQTFIMVLPFFILQFWAGSILRRLGVDAGNADDVAVYSRLMIVTAILNILNSHLEITLNNLGYVKSTMMTSLITGLCIDTTCNYVFVLKWGWGVSGAAFARMLVQCGRCVHFAVVMHVFGLFRTICIGPQTSEKLFSRTELKEYLRMGLPTLLTYFAGWFIFELQILAITNIRGVPAGAVAAGAIWVQCEGALAAAQSGWISSSSMRSLALLGKQDPGARKAFWLFHHISAVIVLIVNMMVLATQSFLRQILSNDTSVHDWLGKILWILTLHCQTRISSLITFIFYVPLGRGMLRTWITFGTFYLVAVPIVVVVALSDVVTTSVTIKLSVVVGSTSIAQALQVVLNFVYLSRLDWELAGAIINRRANADKRII